MELMFLRFLNLPVVIWILETRPVSWFLGLFLPWLQKDDPLPENRNLVKFIFLVSYAATLKRLTWMSESTTCVAGYLATQYPQAKVIGCEFSKNPEGAKEWSQKLLILPRSRSYWAGKASNSINEEKMLVVIAKQLSGDINNSIVVGGGAHIRRVRMAWKHDHPWENLYFRCTDARKDGDLENPMTAQRRWQTWVVANLVGILFYKLLGVEYFAKKNLSQPVE
jgi:hypothetical protein